MNRLAFTAFMLALAGCVQTPPDRPTLGLAGFSGCSLADASIASGGPPLSPTLTSTAGLTGLPPLACR